MGCAKASSFYGQDFNQLLKLVGSTPNSESDFRNPGRVRRVAGQPSLDSSYAHLVIVLRVHEPYPPVWMRKLFTARKDRASTYVLTLVFISLTNVYVRLKYEGAHQRLLHPSRPYEDECLPRSMYMRSTVEVLFGLRRPSELRTDICPSPASCTDNIVCTRCRQCCKSLYSLWRAWGRGRTTLAFSSSTR